MIFDMLVVDHAAVTNFNCIVFKNFAGFLKFLFCFCCISNQHRYLTSLGRLCCQRHWFRDIGFNIEIQTNLKENDFLDVAQNIQDGSYRPYKKPNDKLLYIYSSSNHPPKTIKQLPNFISERFSKNFFSKEIFNIAKAEHKVSQKNSTNNVDLKYTNNK